MAQDSK